MRDPLARQREDTEEYYGTAPCVTLTNPLPMTATAMPSTTCPAFFAARTRRAYSARRARTALHAARTICNNRCLLSSKRRRPPPRRGPLATPPPHTPPLRLPPHQSASCRHPYRVRPPQQPLPQQAVRRRSTRPLRRQHWRHRRQSQRTSIPSSPLRSRRRSGCGSLGRAGRRTSPSSLHSSSAPGPPTSRVRPSTTLVMWTFTPCGRRGEHASHIHPHPAWTRSCEARAHARGSLAACHHR